MQSALKTTAEAGAGGASALIAGGALSPGKCDTPNFSDLPLFHVEQYAFTVDDLFRTMAAIATAITIAYFLNKFKAS